MFTGIVTGTGRVVAADRRNGAMRLRIETGDFLAGCRVGSSVAVDGVCLTLVQTAGGEVEVDVVPETLARTTLGELAPGRLVNLEGALRLGDRLDGHLVQGHVDGVGVVADVGPEGAGRRLRIAVSEALTPYLVEKGSVAVDGVSLTVAGLGEGWFEVALIPHTLEVTVLGDRRPGDRVNLEVDLFAKYAERLLQRREAR